MPKYYSYVTAPLPPVARQTATTDLLAGNATWTSVTFDTAEFEKITGSVFSDKVGKLYIEQSNDRSNWDIASTYDIPNGDGKGFTDTILLPYTRVRYVNGAVAQTAFRLYFNFS